MAVARPSLGANTRIEVYKLLHYTLRDILEDEFWHVKTDEYSANPALLQVMNSIKNTLLMPVTSPDW